MKISLYMKILLGYIIYGMLGFLVIALVSSQKTLEKLESDQAYELYDEAYIIAQACQSQYSDGSLELDQVVDQLSVISSLADTEIWIVDVDGRLLYRDGQTTDLLIEDFSAADSGRGLYEVGTYHDMFDEDVLTVISPISANFSTYGYVIIHQSMDTLFELREDILDVIYITFIIIFGLSFLVLACVHVFIFRPLQKITRAANEYASGNLGYHIKIRSDDEIGTLADTLNYMAGEIRDKEADQRKFISNVSHDFRSPLTSIKGYLEAMIDGTIPPEQHEKYMRRVIAETDRLAKLSSSMLELQAMDSHGNMLDISVFDINQVIRDTVASFEVICQKKQITFDLIFAERSLYVRADMGKIQQVIYNLTDNAIKFSGTGSTVWIETYEKHDKAFISVKDAGIGIPKEDQKKIWARFYKSDNSRGRDKTGAGIGLSIIKEIMNAHNENIDVISTEGIGTEFIFTLPKAGRNTR